MLGQEDNLNKIINNLARRGRYRHQDHEKGLHQGAHAAPLLHQLHTARFIFIFADRRDLFLFSRLLHQSQECKTEQSLDPGLWRGEKNLPTPYQIQMVDQSQARSWGLLSLALLQLVGGKENRDGSKIGEFD